MAYNYFSPCITGTSTTPKVFKESGISYAKVGQTNLNRNTGNVYVCTENGTNTQAKWRFRETVIVGKPDQSVWNLSTPSRSGYTFNAKWKVPDKLVKGSNGRRATELSVDWYLGIAGTDPKAHKVFANQKATTASINLNNVTIQGKQYTRQSFYPFPKKPYLSYLTCTVLGKNSKGTKTKTDRDSCTYSFKKPLKPTISDPVINASNGTVSVTVTSDPGAGNRERYDTRYIVTVENTRTGSTWEHVNSSTTSTSIPLSYDPPDYQALSHDEYIRVTFKAWNRGFAGDSDTAEKQYTVSFAAQTTITSKTATNSQTGKATFFINTNSSKNHPVDQVRLEYIANTTYMTADQIPGDLEWTSTDIVDDAECKALTIPVARLIPDPGHRTWVHVKSYHGIEQVLVRYSEAVYLDELETVPATATDESIRILDKYSGDDGRSAVVVLGWNESGADDADGTELTWSEDPEAWISTKNPEEYLFSWSDGEKVWTEEVEGQTVTTTYHDSATIHIKGLDEGTPVHIRARRYLDGERTTYSPYSNIATVTPNVAPYAVVLDVPTYVSRGSSIPFAWTYGGGGTQMAWQLLTDSGTLIANGENAMGSYNLSSDRANSLAVNGVLSARVEVATGSDFVSSEVSNIQIVDAPTISITVPSTITTQANNSFSVTSNRECSLIAVVSALGSSGISPIGIRYQPEGETVWSGSLNPAWTLSNNVYTATVNLPSGLDLLDQAQYLIECTAIDNSTNLRSNEVSGVFSVAWAHQAIAPGDYCEITPNDYTDEDGQSHKTATISWDIPSTIVDPDTQETLPGFLTGDVVDVYRLTGDGATLIGSNYPSEYEVTDEYAPFGSNVLLAYRIAVRTPDGDIECSDVYYTLPGNMIRFDWPGGVLELPYDITLSDSYAKDKTTRKHLDGTTNVYYNDGVSRTGKQSTRLVRLLNQSDIDLVRSLARYPGNAFIRLPDGCAYEGCVEITDISTEGVIDTFSLSTIETATTQAYMLPIPLAVEDD